MIFVQTSKNNVWSDLKVMKRNRPVLCPLMMWNQTALFCYRFSQVGKMHGIIRDDNSAEVTGVIYFHTSLRLM